jgi:putative transposase
MRVFRLRQAVLERLYPMTRSKFAEQQIAFALQQVETRTSVKEVCRKMGMSQATFYRWKKVYGGQMPSEVRRLRQFEGENARLRRRVANLSLDKEMPIEVIRKEL